MDDSRSLSPTVPSRVAEFFAEGGAETSVSLEFLSAHPSLLSALAPGSDEPAGDAVGDVVGGHRLTAYIGGGMAEVYECRAAVTCAIKVSRRGDLQGAEIVTREAALLRENARPGLVPVLDSGRDGGRAWFTMPRLSGPSLHELMCDGGPSDVTDVIRWMTEIAEVLGALHAAGVVHRDVKPANIVLDGGRATLIDLGLADRSSFVHGIRELAGTLPYMSPEQTLGGLAAVEPPSDVYSVAATFYEAATGVKIAELDGRARMLEAIAFSSVPRISKFRRVTPGLDRVFAHALQKDPAQRYQSGRELTEDLAALQADRAPIHAHEPRRTATWRWFRRHPRWSGAGLIVALAFAGLGAAQYVEAAAARAARVAAIEEPLLAGDVAAAVEQLDRRPELLDDPDVMVVVRNFRESLGRTLTQDVIRRTGFTVAGSTTGEIEVAELRAKRLHELVGGIDFALQQVWLGLHRRGATWAWARYSELPESRGPDVRMADLGLILAQEMGETEEVKQREAELQELTLDANLTVLEMCFRAYRMVHRVAVGRAVESLRLEPEDERLRLERAHSILTFALAQESDNLFAHSCMGLVGITAGDYATAERHLRHAVSHAPRGSADGALLQLYRLSVLSGGERGPVDLSSLAALEERRPSARWWVTKNTCRDGANDTALDLLLSVDPASVPFHERSSLAQLTLDVMVERLRAGGFDRVDQLGEWAHGWDTLRWDTEARSKAEEVSALWCWLGYQVGTAMERAGHGEAAEKWLAHSVTTASRCLPRPLLRPYEIRAVRALARSAGVRISLDTSVAQRRRSAALAEILELLEPAERDAAIRAATTDAHRAGVQGAVKLLQRARDELTRSGR